ncbi:MAG: ATP-binding cassette domain-containing protein, partial [Myxococcota bacterium]
MTLLSAQQIARSYGTRVVLGNVSLSLDQGDRVGLVGVNGAGKSTLARILAGVEEADQGEVVLRRSAVVGYLPQQPRFEGNPTARMAALAGLARWRAAIEKHQELSDALGSGQGNVDALLEAQQEAAAEVERLGGWNRDQEAIAMLSRVGAPAPDRTVETMSGGEQRRVDLARLLVSRPDVMILDEPTNHLDVETIEWLETHLTRDQPGALLVITHDRYFLDRVASRTAEIHNGELSIYDGGYRAYLEAKAEREAHE